MKLALCVNDVMSMKMASMQHSYTRGWGSNRMVGINISIILGVFLFVVTTDSKSHIHDARVYDRKSDPGFF